MKLRRKFTSECRAGFRVWIPLISSFHCIGTYKAIIVLLQFESPFYCTQSSWTTGKPVSNVATLFPWHQILRILNKDLLWNGKKKLRNYSATIIRGIGTEENLHIFVVRKVRSSKFYWKVAQLIVCVLPTVEYVLDLNHLLLRKNIALFSCTGRLICQSQRWLFAHEIYQRIIRAATEAWNSMEPCPSDFFVCASIVETCKIRHRMYAQVQIFRIILWKVWWVYVLQQGMCCLRTDGIALAIRSQTTHNSQILELWRTSRFARTVS